MTFIILKWTAVLKYILHVLSFFSFQLFEILDAFLKRLI